MANKLKRKTRITFNLPQISRDRIEDIVQNLDFLDENSEVETFQSFRDKKIDYSTGFREITVSVDYDSRDDFSFGKKLLKYTIEDYAPVENVVNSLPCIGRKSYTEKEIGDLKKSLNVNKDLFDSE